MTIIPGLLLGAVLVWLLTRPSVRKQLDRVPEWIRQALWSGMLTGCVVHSYANGSPYLGGFFCLLFGLDLDQYLEGRRIAQYKRLIDQWSKMYDELFEHSKQQHESLVEAYAAMKPIADRIEAQARAEKGRAN